MNAPIPDKADSNDDAGSYWPIEFARDAGRISQLTAAVNERQAKEQAAIQEILQVIDEHSDQHDSKVSIFPQP